MKIFEKLFTLFKILPFIIFFIPKVYGVQSQPFWKNFYITGGIEAYRYYKDTSNVMPERGEVAPFLFGMGYDINKNHSISVNFMDFDFWVEYSSTPFGEIFNETINEAHELRNIDITYTYYFLNSQKGKFMFINMFSIENHNVDINVDILGRYGQKLNFNDSFVAKNNMFKTGIGYRFFVHKYMDISLYYLLGMYQHIDDKNYDKIRALGANIPYFERFNHFIEVNLIWHF